MTEGRYYGKYRATVLNNVDLEYRGRIQMTCPDVVGLLPTSWAEACAPLSGTPPMGVYLVPPIGAAVWAEFEAGDIERPIWTGCRWASKTDVPTDATIGLPASPNIVVQTLAQHALILSDMPPSPKTGGIVLRSTTKATIVVNDTGIFIDNGKGASIELVGSSVLINKTALVVT